MKFSKKLSRVAFFGVFLFVNLFIFGNKVSAEISCDFNSDSSIDITDLALVANKYNMKNTDRGWDSRNDLNSDNIIDIFDISLLSKHIGIPYTDYSKLGNSAGNINNGGITVLNNGWLYTNSDSQDAVRMKEDGTQKELLTVKRLGDINVVGSFVFYVNLYNNRLYRTNTDGSNDLCINEQDEIYNLIVYNGYIYYCNYSDSGKIYRAKFDGSERTKITDDTYCRHINIAGKYLYYSGGGSLLYRVNLDGTNRKLLNADKCSYEILKDGTIYFINDSFNSNLYKMNFDGTDIKKLNDDRCAYLNISGNVLYYQNINDNGEIYAIKTDGTQRTHVNTEKASNINIAGNKIYYKADDDYGFIHSISLINLDGNEIPPDSRSFGNLPGNINNKAFAASDGENIYINKNGIYRYNSDYTNELYIGNQRYSDINYLNISNGWLYYAAMTPNVLYGDERIYKIKADGSGEKIQLSTNRAFYMTVAGGWIYYTTQEHDSYFEGGGLIHKVRIDGTGETYVNSNNSDYAAYLNISGEYIYYVNTKDNMAIYRVKTDGTGRIKISDEPARGLNVMGEYIYYNSDYYGKLKRIPISGGSSVTLKDYVSENFIVTDDKIYYCDLSSIYSSNLDGSSETLIDNYSVSSQMNIAGNYLFYGGGKVKIH